MTKKQFIELEAENGFDFAIENLRNEINGIMTQETLIEMVGEDVGDWIITGKYNKALATIKKLNDFDGTEYWFYDYLDRFPPVPLQSYEDVQFLLDDD